MHGCMHARMYACMRMHVCIHAYIYIYMQTLLCLNILFGVGSKGSKRDITLGSSRTNTQLHMPTSGPGGGVVWQVQANDKVMSKSLLYLCGHVFPHVNADSKKSLLSHASATIPMERLTSPSWSCFKKTGVKTETQWNATDGKACFPAPQGVCRNMKTNGTPSIR